MVIFTLANAMQKESGIIFFIYDLLRPCSVLSDYKFERFDLANRPDSENNAESSRNLYTNKSQSF